MAIMRIRFFGRKEKARRSPGPRMKIFAARRFVSQSGDMGVVIHEFYLEGNPTRSEIDNYPVRIVSRKRLEQGAVSLPRPLRVTIPR